MEFLDSLGYAVVAVQPVDMFPHTDHIECIVALEPVDSLSPERWGKEGGEEAAEDDCEEDEADGEVTPGEEIDEGEAPDAKAPEEASGETPEEASGETPEEVAAEAPDGETAGGEAAGPAIDEEVE